MFFDEPEFGVNLETGPWQARHCAICRTGCPDDEKSSTNAKNATQPAALTLCQHTFILTRCQRQARRCALQTGVSADGAVLSKSVLSDTLEKKKMKILVITGSPRKNGNSNTLVDNFIKGATENGHNVVRFDSAFKCSSMCRLQQVRYEWRLRV